MKSRLNHIYSWLAFSVLLTACNQSPNADSNNSKDTLRTTAASSKALNTLKRSEQYENVERINARIIRKSKGKFRHIRNKDTDTVLVRSNTSLSPGAYLTVQFEVVENQAFNLRLELSYAGRNCLLGEKYRLSVDHQSFDLIPAHVNRSKKTNCVESATIEPLPQLLMEAVAHASSVVIEFDQPQSTISRKIPPQSIRECREAYEYYMALGGKL